MDFWYAFTWIFIWGVYGNILKMFKLSSKQELILSLFGLFIIYKKTDGFKKYDN
tara:strand:+ start:8031 stop:8192 length:162 start_codon:yes stop_codon:yes gene_type:complete